MLAYVGLTSSRSELLPRTRGDVGAILATGVLAIGLTNALLFVGQQYVTSAVASIVYSLNPIMTPVFAAFLLSDERLSPRGGAGMGLGLLGVGLVVSPDPANLLGVPSARGSSSSARSPPRWGRPHPPGRQRSLEHGPRRLGTTLRRGAKPPAGLVERRVGGRDHVVYRSDPRAGLRQHLRRRHRVHRLLRPHRYGRRDPREPDLLRRPRRLDARRLGAARRDHRRARDRRLPDDLRRLRGPGKRLDRRSLAAPERPH